MKAASLTEWVTKIEANRWAEYSAISSSLSRDRVIWSRAPNGSSKRNRSGASSSDRARLARIFIPPDSASG